MTKDERKAYQEAREYMAEGFPRGMDAYMRFREICRQCGFDYRQILSELRRERWEKTWGASLAFKSSMARSETIVTAALRHLASCELSPDRCTMPSAMPHFFRH